MFENENVIYIKNGRADSLKSFLLLKRVIGSKAKNYCKLDSEGQDKYLQDTLERVEESRVNFFSIDNNGKSIKMDDADVLIFLDNYLTKIIRNGLSNSKGISATGVNAPSLRPEKWTSNRIIFDSEGNLFEEHTPNQIILAIIDHYHHSYLSSADRDVKFSDIIDEIYNESIEIGACFYRFTEPNQELNELNEDETKSLLKEVLLSFGFGNAKNTSDISQIIQNPPNVLSTELENIVSLFAKLPEKMKKIFMGRGGRINNNPANQYLLEYIRADFGRYAECEKGEMKQLFNETIDLFIKNGASFGTIDADSGEFKEERKYERIYDKIAHMYRDQRRQKKVSGL